MITIYKFWIKTNKNYNKNKDKNLIIIIIKIMIYRVVKMNKTLNKIIK